MLLLDLLAERRITEAMEKGAFDGLEGAGRPLPEDDLGLVPEELRAGYRLLKNAGYIPPELEMRKEAISLALQLAALDERSDVAYGADPRRSSLLERLNRLNLMLAEAGKPQLAIPLEYVARLAEKD